MFNSHGKLQKAVSSGAASPAYLHVLPSQLAMFHLLPGGWPENLQEKPCGCNACLGRLAPTGTGGNRLSQKILLGLGVR